MIAYYMYKSAVAYIYVLAFHRLCCWVWRCRRIDGVLGFFSSHPISPSPQPQASVPPPPQPKEGGFTLSGGRVRGWGSPNSDDWRKRLALCLFWAMYKKKQKIRQPNESYCTLYSIQCTLTLRNHTMLHAKSNQFRTMNVRGHINSVQWLYGVASTP
jgi:hypothetical protein